MFDLEQAIAQWRRQMLAAGIHTPVPLEELEIHLREEIEQGVESGLEEPEAFNSAVQNLGPAQGLRTEFEKTAETKAARNGRLFEMLLLASVVWLPLCVGGKVYAFKSDGFMEMTFSQQISTLTAAVTFSLLAWGMRSIYGRFPVVGSNRIRDAIFVPVLLWVVACIIILPHCNFTDGQRVVVSLWGFTPFGILIGWCWGFATAARKKAATADVSASQS